MDWVLLLAVLIQIESGGNHAAVGDKHLNHKAYGILQIRQPYLDDVNRIAKTSFTIDDIRNSESLSRWATVTYIKHYGERYERITGNPLTYEVAGAIHNAGPNGWKKECANTYKQKVSRAINSVNHKHGFR